MKPPNHGCRVTAYLNGGARVTGYLAYDLLGAPTLQWSGMCIITPTCTPTGVETLRQGTGPHNKDRFYGTYLVLEGRYAPVADLVRKPKLAPINRKVN